ncbi:polysaccharide biosynthesis tyrosine autokinase [Amnibacterium sp. CER49]|uniref:polysaccharide biosynthesis tyrosine autokinase n=1 Tax=Amnibacterium sp. CER49 TaxID=3039161 RepID=UPI002447B4A2|nr:polysaccharide biosynthesis tyrosine autokinase [Amnibacterium sp. CER49]MDH2443036.1 polysaccharide biosynthesis tyrosine autokinase [Amnibacterium sp. CER49]
MSPQDLIRLLRRYWLLTVVLVLIGVASGIGASLTMKPMYSATSTAVVQVASDGQSVQDVAVGAAFAQKAVETFASVATSQRVLDPVIKTVGLSGTTSAQLAKRISVGTSTNNQVMNITASDPSPDRAAAIADQVESQLSHVVATALNSTTKGSAAPTVVLISHADVPKAPSSPNTGLNALVGGILGLLVALVLIGVRRLLLDKIESVEELQSITEVPVVGEIVRDRGVTAQPLRVLADPLGSYAESVRDLRTNLQYLTTAEGAQTIVVTSAAPGEGKTTTSVNLGLSLAGAQSVVLVDADLRKPRIADVLGIDGAVGLTDVLVGRVSLDDALQTVGDSGLVVLPAGGHPPNAAELLQSAAMRRLLGELSQRYSTVLFDSPPSGLLSDARVLARECSGALVVTGLRRAKRAQLRTTLQSLERAGAKTLGIVATFVPGTNSAYYELERAEGIDVQRKRSRRGAPRVRPAQADPGSAS